MAKILDPVEIKEKAEEQQFIDNRRKRFVELLGEDCEYTDAFVLRTDISPWDVNALLEKGCPLEKIPEILL